MAGFKLGSGVRSRHTKGTSGRETGTRGAGKGDKANVQPRESCEPCALASVRFRVMRRSLRTTTLALAAASFLALLEILRTTLTRVFEGRTVTSADVHGVLPMWLTIVIASPWCAFMAARFPFHKGRTLRTLAAHVGGGLVFVAIHIVLLYAYHTVIGGARFIPSPTHVLHMYFFYIALEMSIYAGIVVVLLLLDARREAAEREVTAARLSESLAAARLEGLQAQIRPHFLFNTLNALAVLARRGDGAGGGSRDRGPGRASARVVRFARPARDSARRGTRLPRALRQPAGHPLSRTASKWSGPSTWKREARSSRRSSCSRWSRTRSSTASRLRAADACG